MQTKEATSFGVELVKNQGFILKKDSQFCGRWMPPGSATGDPPWHLKKKSHFGKKKKKKCKTAEIKACTNFKPTNNKSQRCAFFHTDSSSLKLQVLRMNLKFHNS